MDSSKGSAEGVTAAEAVLVADRKISEGGLLLNIQEGRVVGRRREGGRAD
jgi:hypothetical protein